jgi:hypothetical protein
MFRDHQQPLAEYGSEQYTWTVVGGSLGRLFRAVSGMRTG